MFRGEYVGRVDFDACNGCRSCMRQCHFGAIRYSAANKKVAIDVRQCYGCGVCRSTCNTDAIMLLPRSGDIVGLNIW
jgi:MinD superfamily P-loop ATPase